MSDEGGYKVALAGTLPTEQASGWADEGFAETLDRDRVRTRYALVAYNVASAKEVTATGKKILTVQLQRIEPVPDDDADEFASTLSNYFEDRTGQTMLPLKVPGGE
jgi:hypothetical protein